MSSWKGFSRTLILIAHSWDRASISDQSRSGFGTVTDQLMVITEEAAAATICSLPQLFSIEVNGTELVVVPGTATTNIRHCA